MIPKSCLAAMLLACASPAFAQVTPSQAAINRATANQNADWAARQITDQKVRAEQARLQAEADRVQTQMRIDQAREAAETRLPDPVYPKGTEPAPIANDAPLPQIPDAVLAASRQRVLAASHRHGWRLPWQKGG